MVTNLFPIILSILLSVNFFWIKPFLPGFDTPFYLSAIRDFAQNLPSIINYSILDRYLVIAFPALISRIFNLDPMMSYRIAITAISVVIAILLTNLMTNLTKSRLAGIALSSAVIVSPYLLGYAYMLFANYTSFIILFAFFAIESGKDYRLKNIILGLILGLIFYVHNFSSIAYGMVIGLYFLLKIILDQNKFNTLKKAVIVLLISCTIGFFQLIRYFPVSLPPFTARASSSIVNPIVENIKIIFPSQPMILGDEAERIQKTFLEETGKYWLAFFLIFSMFVLIAKRKELKPNRRKFALPLALFIIGALFTFQPLIGLNFLPERFVGLVTLSTFIFYAVFLSLFKKGKLFKILSVLPLLFIYLSADTRILSRGPVLINESEVAFYQKIDELTTKEDSYIMIPSGNYYWAKYYLDGYVFMPGDYFIACGTVKIEGHENAPDVAFAKLLTNSNIEEAQKQLNTIKLSLRDDMIGKNVYLMTNHSANCSEGLILDKLKGVKLILNQDNFNLYEII